ncbi:MAG: hypothetical protein K6F29_09420 [Bacteroidales bacterium]|nr:hypothetical protein [Bacteroidales bacterium]
MNLNKLKASEEETTPEEVDELKKVLASDEVKELEGLETFMQLAKWFFNPLKMRTTTIISLILIAITLILGIYRNEWLPFVVIVSATILRKSYLLLYEWRLVKVIKEYNEAKDFDNYLRSLEAMEDEEDGFDDEDCFNEY